MYEPLIPAQVEAGQAHVPFSPRYGDVYHSSAGGLEQSSHVFLQGNGLPGRWQGRHQFTVLETGFGLGINFLALWRAWRDDPRRCARLHMVSVEAHPFTRPDLARWLRRLLPASFEYEICQLTGQWPLLLPGIHRLEFERNAVTLTLAFGRAEQILPRLACQADAIFLDGFAPRANPDMWSPAVLAEIARCAAPDATAATWAASGMVRRNLMAAGFSVEKRPGFAGKREMTVARFAGRSSATVSGTTSRPGRALVVGGGPAGAAVAWSLARRGWETTVVADNAGPGGASLGQDTGRGTCAGHLAAALTPVVDRQDSHRARLSRAGVLRTHSLWRLLASEGESPAERHKAIRVTGTVQVMRRAHGRDEASMRAWLEAFAALRMPPEWMVPLDVADASALAGQRVSRGGLFLPQGTLVRPPLWCATLLEHPGVRLVRSAGAGLRQTGSYWDLECRDGNVLRGFDVAVVAAGARSASLLAGSQLPQQYGWLDVLQVVGGQITLVPAGEIAGSIPVRIVSGDGYVLPEVDGWCTIGSTYDHDSPPGQPIPVSDAMHGYNLQRARALLPQLGTAAVPPARCSGWTGWRAVVPGRLPFIGGVPGCPGLWLATAYASRGFNWSMLAGEIIAGELSGEPAQLEIDLLAAVAPGRLLAVPALVG